MTHVEQMPDDGVMRAADGTPLKKRLARALRREKMRSFVLIAPLLFFILLSFLAPIADMLFRSVENDIVQNTIPETVTELQNWDSASGSAPPEEVYAAFYRDFLVAREKRIHTRLGSRLNYELSGMSGMFRRTGRDIRRFDEAGPFKPQFIKSDEDWGAVETWRVIKKFSSLYTAGYYLSAIDAESTSESFELKPADERIYIKLFIRTMWMSLLITFSTLLLGYPIAYLMSHTKRSTANLLMILVLLPFWTSLLVRTSAWKVLLQQQGVINDFLVWINVVDDSARLVMINNQLGTIIAMTHILLPFMILPLYSVMQTISPSYVRAAKSMGANDWTAFWRVYFPNTIPGIGAGAILVFILAIGYYITPELVGGTQGVFISNRIAFHISSSLNWGLAAALGAILLLLVLLLFYCYDKIVGIDNVKLG
ncbi:MAG: ABC transporter permease [Pseudomonadota bacterium]